MNKIYIKPEYNLLENKESNMDIEETEQNAPKNRLIYDLYAVTNHYGGLGGGHYTAFAMNNNSWYCFNDSHVSTVTENEICSDASYILFYKKK